MVYLIIIVVGVGYYCRTLVSPDAHFRHSGAQQREPPKSYESARTFVALVQITRVGENYCFEGLFKFYSMGETGKLHSVNQGLLMHACPSSNLLRPL